MIFNCASQSTCKNQPLMRCVRGIPGEELPNHLPMTLEVILFSNYAGFFLFCFFMLWELLIVYLTK